MDKSLFILSAPLLTMLVHADESSALSVPQKVESREARSARAARVKKARYMRMQSQVASVKDSSYPVEKKEEIAKADEPVDEENGVCQIVLAEDDDLSEEFLIDEKKEESDRQEAALVEERKAEEIALSPASEEELETETALEEFSFPPLGEFMEQSELPLSDLLAQDEQENPIPTVQTTKSPGTLEDRVACLEQKLCECCDPFAHPDHDFYVWGEWLYWKFTEGGTEYAINPVTTSLTTPPDIPGGHVKKVEFDWKSGFRVGVGYRFEEKGWDLALYYSEVKPHGSSSTTGNVFPLLYYIDSEPVNLVTNASANWKIKYQVLDFELGRSYQVDPTLILRPFFGAKAAKINQHVNIAYNNNGSNPAITVPPAGHADTLFEKNNFKGIGLRIGMDTLWEMSQCYGLSLYGGASASLLVSKIEVGQTQSEYIPEFVANNVDLRSEFHRLLPVVELDFGIMWSKGFCCDRYRLSLFAGIEGQYWWRQNYLEHFTGDVNMPAVFVRPTEDLGIYGLDVGASFDF